jgi:hypothetical protein
MSHNGVITLKWVIVAFNSHRSGNKLILTHRRAGKRMLVKRTEDSVYEFQENSEAF